jgi:hypothetical protein
MAKVIETTRLTITKGETTALMVAAPLALPGPEEVDVGVAVETATVAAVVVVPLLPTNVAKPIAGGLYWKTE